MAKNKFKIPEITEAQAKKMTPAERKAFGIKVANAVKRVAKPEVIAEFLRNINPPPFHEWVKDITLDGKPFSYERHEYLVEPYRDMHPFLVFLKATQMGLTSYAMLLIVYLARFNKELRNILYFFPSKTDVVDFVRGRINPLVTENPDTIGSWVRERATDSTGMKQIWDTFLYFRGMRSRVGMKGTPGDFIVIDELDEADEKFEFWLKMRMTHSEVTRMLKLSNPTMPDSGIDKEFQQTDQRYWLLKCDKCGKYTDLVETFPDCLVTFKGDVIRLCMSCRDRALNPSNGVWVAKKPGVTEKRGYQFSQLWSQFVHPAEIFDDYRTSEHISDFWNLTIGVAHVEAENRLSIEEVLSLCGDNEIASSDTGPCFMGVDQGKDLHVVIGKRHFGKAGEIIHMGVYSPKDEWKDLDALMRNFNISRCVVDDAPEIAPPRAFAQRFSGKVFLNRYNIHQIGNYAWNERELRVSANRTETLDASHFEIMDRNLILPKQCEIVREFAKHLHNVAKKLEEEYRTDTDGTRYKTGIKKYVYKKLGEDHFRHAYNYEAMARQFGMKSLFGGCVN